MEFVGFVIEMEFVISICNFFLVICLFVEFVIRPSVSWFK